MCEVQSGTGRHGLAAAGRHDAVRHGGVDLRRLLGRRSMVFAGVILTGDWIEGVFRAGGACVARDRARVQTRENKKSKEVIATRWRTGIGTLL